MKKVEELPEPGRLVAPDGTDLEKDGMILLYRYVKPFMRVVRGFGFKGIQEVRVSDKKALCKICGMWCERVSVHALKAHGYSHLDYKREFGLAMDSSLDGEEEREQKIRVARSSRSSRRRVHRARKVGGPRKPRMPTEHAVEFFNKRGTCDLQLVMLIRNTAKKLGRSPAPAEVVMNGVSMNHTIRSRLAYSWGDVLAVCGLKPQWKEYGKGFVPGSGTSHRTDDRLFPESSYRPPGRYYTKKDGRVRNVRGRVYWEGETLLLWARLLYQRKGRWPSRSDLKRGNNGPNLANINRDFGSFPEFIEWAKTNLHWRTIWKHRKAKMPVAGTRRSP